MPKLQSDQRRKMELYVGNDASKTFEARRGRPELPNVPVLKEDEIHALLADWIISQEDQELAWGVLKIVRTGSEGSYGLAPSKLLKKLESRYIFITSRLPKTKARTNKAQDEKKGSDPGRSTSPENESKGE